MKMEALIRNLAEIEQWAENAPHPNDFKTENDALKFFMEVMCRSLYLLRTGVVLAPTDEKAQRGYVKHQAIIAGHMIRITKLYDGFCQHTANRQLELAGVMMRLIFETDIRLRYLMEVKKPSAFRSYVLTSYRSEKASLIDLNAKAKKRKLIPIERRIRNAIRKELREDGIGVNELINNRNWRIDGKDVRGMLKYLGREGDYSYTFGSSSRWVHGGWLELKKYHLIKKGRYYMPRLDWGEPDFRVVAPITGMCLDTLTKYLIWNKSDPDGIVQNISSKLFKIIEEFDDYDESKRVSRQTS